jgi:hypothetical protein
MMKLVKIAALALALLAIPLSSANAGIYIGVGRPYYYRPYYRPYYGPSVYIAPAPVYVAPPPVYVQPAPVVVPPTISGYPVVPVR